MIILGIDPGTTETAYTLFDGIKLIESNKVENSYFEKFTLIDIAKHGFIDKVLIEGIASYGMPVGKETFETCYFIGRLMKTCELMSFNYEIVLRRDIKSHFCNSMKAKDGNISQALKDRFGDKGTKSNPGFFFGISSDMWSSTAIAVYGFDKYSKNL